MQQTTIFGPFHKDKIINATYTSQVFLPNSIIQKWALHTCKYAKADIPPTYYKEVKDHKILQLIVIYYCMGLVKLLLKRIIGGRGVFGLPMVLPLACQGTASIISGGNFMYCIWETKIPTMPRMMKTMLFNFLIILGTGAGGVQER